MGKHILKTCDSLKHAISYTKERLLQMDAKNIEYWEWRQENYPNRESKYSTMEEEYYNDELYLVYRNDYYIDECWIFSDAFDIQYWLEEKWSDWDLWDYGDINGFLEENLVIWKFHRNIQKEKWSHLCNGSKQFMQGWSRKREYVSFEAVPSFSVG